ncbi:HNH endonuclease [Emergencia timonensis]|uniref:HNH endonuclease n=1 Tax=Emergencia timonensis TaxID=1776384 RepID=UPI001D07AE80|nr:HNH endonuclease [Emergencia timonensis]MCB6475567.1 HNH endonuclease [Emergencia timonensis]
MSKMSKACEIPPKVRRKVWARDEGRCIICGNPQAKANAHYIRRSQGGLGVEQNIVTLCQKCHDDFDNGRMREENGKLIRDYLKARYKNWDEQKLYYDKWDWVSGDEN